MHLHPAIILISLRKDLEYYKTNRLTNKKEVLEHWAEMLDALAKRADPTYTYDTHCCPGAPR